MYWSVVLCKHFMCWSCSRISEYTAVAIFRVRGRRMDGWVHGWMDGFYGLYVCMYVRTYVRTFIRVHTYVRIYVCMDVRMYVSMYVCTYVCMYACTYILAVGIMMRTCSTGLFNGKGQGGSEESLEKWKWNQTSCFYLKDGGRSFLKTVVPIHQLRGISITHHQIITLRLWSVFIHPHRWHCNSLIISISWK